MPNTLARGLNNEGPKAARPGDTGRALLAQFLRGKRLPGRPLLFLDFDDVICVNDPYGGRDLMRAAGDQPPDLWDRLWHRPSTDALLRAIDEHSPRVVITSSWLRFIQRDGMVSLFHRTGLQAVAESLHDAWEAPQDYGATRLQAIEAWLGKHYEGQSMVILDDSQSGTGLRGSKLEKNGCVVLCEVEQGLGDQHLPIIRKALGAN